MLTVGEEAGFDGVLARLVELAYTRVDMVGKRGEFAVRGGILDVFAPTAEHPVRVEFWGDEVSRDADVLRRRPAVDPRDRRRHRDRGAVPRTAADRGRPRARGRAGRASSRTTTTASPAASATCWPSSAEGIPVDGMEALLPVLRPDRADAADRPPARRRAGADLRPGEGAHPRGRPGQDGPRIPRGVVVGGRRRGPMRRSTSSSSADRDSVNSTTCGPRRREGGHPWWTLSSSSNAVAIELDIRAAPSARGQQSEPRRDLRDAARPRRRPAASPRSSRPAPAPRTASSSSWPNPTLPQRCWSRARDPKPGVVGVLKGPLHDGVVLPGANLVVDHRDRPDRQPGHRDRGQAACRQAPQRRRPAGADRGRPGRARPARHRPVRRDDRAHRRRRAPRVPGAGVRVGKAGRRVRQAVRADGLAGSAVPLRRRAGADAQPARRQRLDQHEDQGAQGGSRDRR